MNVVNIYKIKKIISAPAPDLNNFGSTGFDFGSSTANTAFRWPEICCNPAFPFLLSLVFLVYNMLQPSIGSLRPFCKQCCGAATFLGGSSSGRLRSLSDSVSNQIGLAPAPQAKKRLWLHTLKFGIFGCTDKTSQAVLWSWSRPELDFLAGAGASEKALASGCCWLA